MESNKQAVKDFWNEASCGEELYLKGADAARGSGLCTLFAYINLLESMKIA